MPIRRISFIYFSSNSSALNEHCNQTYPCLKTLCWRDSSCNFFARIQLAHFPFFTVREAHHRLLQVREHFGTRGRYPTGIQWHQLPGAGHHTAIQRILKRERAIANWRSIRGTVRPDSLQMEAHASWQGLRWLHQKSFPQQQTVRPGSPWPLEKQLSRLPSDRRYLQQPGIHVPMLGTRHLRR